MFSITAKLVKAPPSADKILKNINYGTAVGLTKTAKEGQSAVVGALQGAFTIRNGWWRQNTPVGIKVKPATKTNLKAEIYTNAHFLPVHEQGGTKIPYKNYIAVPTKFAQPNKSRRIPQANLPKNLVGAFVITSNGTRLLVVRRTRGKNKGIVPMYVLTKKAKEKKVDIWEKPIEKVIHRRLNANVEREVTKALATMR